MAHMKLIHIESSQERTVKQVAIKDATGECLQFIRAIKSCGPLCSG